MKGKKSKRCIKKLMCMMLALAMTVAFIPGGFANPDDASAATQITEIGISDIDMPLAGETPDYDGIVLDGTKYRFATETEMTALGYSSTTAKNGIVWKHYIDDSAVVMNETEEFVAGDKYICTAILYPMSGYEFAAKESCTFTLNGDPELVNSRGLEVGGKATIPSVELTAKRQIKNIDVSDIDMPVNGNTPDYVGALHRGANYHFASEEEMRAAGCSDKMIAQTTNGIFWKHKGKINDNDMSETEMFLAGDEYFFGVVLAPKNGYKFAPKDKCEITLNGQKKLVDMTYTENSKELLIIYSRDMATEKQKIDIVGINDIDMPVAGKTPDCYGTLPAGANYHLATGNKKITWYHKVNDDYVEMSSKDKFVAGDKYYCDIYFLPNEKYEFAPKKDCTITLNGGTSLIDSSCLSVSSEQIRITSVDVEAAKQKITAAGVLGIDMPITGKTPDYEATVPAGVNYHLATDDEIEGDKSKISKGIYWVHYVDGSRKIMDKTEKFKAGEKYACIAMLIPNEGYEFDEGNNCIVTLNGEESLVNRGSLTVLKDKLDIPSIDFVAEKEYTVKVNKGSGSGNYIKGTKVTIEADKAPTGEIFDKWEVVSGDITLENPADAKTTFTMPASAVEVKAVYKEKIVEYDITVLDGTPSTVKAVKGTKVTITANFAATGKMFDKWVVVNGTVTIDDPTSKVTTFTMPAKGVEVKATYKDIAAPAKVTVKLYGHDDVRAIWTKVDGVTGYKVYYKKSTSKVYKYKGSTKYSSMRIANLTDGAKYYVKIVPCVRENGKLNAGKSKVSPSIYTLKKLNTPKVTKKSSSKVTVKWNNIYGETGYQISKSTSKTKKGTIYTVKTTKGTSKIIAAKKGKTYYYKVRAYKKVDGKGIYGPWSNVRAYKLK